MKLRLRPSDPETCDVLAFFLRRHDCRAEVANDGTVLVGLPHALHREQAGMELCLYIRLWQVLHGVSVRVDPQKGERVT
jgi:hypothetical protein